MVLLPLLSMLFLPVTNFRDEIQLHRFWYKDSLIYGTVAKERHLVPLAVAVDTRMVVPNLLRYAFLLSGRL